MSFVIHHDSLFHYYFGLGRQRDEENGATTGIILDTDCSAMGINDFLHIVKTYTLAIHHGIKGMFLILILDTNTIVGNLNLGLIVLCTSDANTDKRIVRGKVYGVAEQYLKNFLQLHLIEIGSQLVNCRDKVHLDFLFRIW